jgi:hypothetical protein
MKTAVTDTGATNGVMKGRLRAQDRFSGAIAAEEVFRREIFRNSTSAAFSRVLISTLPDLPPFPDATVNISFTNRMLGTEFGCLIQARQCVRYGRPFCGVCYVCSLLELSSKAPNAIQNCDVGSLDFIGLSWSVLW